jgi:hypothetical protein
MHVRPSRECTPSVSGRDLFLSVCLHGGTDTTTYCQLQKVCCNLPSYINSSFSLKKALEELPPLPFKARLFTADAISMYTNIETNHAMQVITTYFEEHEAPGSDFPTEALLAALDIIMKNNVFKFEDTYWLQLTGTAMGTPPAPMYATLYFAIKELSASFQSFEKYLLFYKRYLDDIFGIWICDDDPVQDAAAWYNFQQEMNDFGQLRWEFSERTREVNFLDLTLSIKDDDGLISTRLFEKKLNLYLYLPPLSAHPPGVLRGLIYGMILRIYRLTSDPTQCETMVKTFFGRLLARGYSPDRIRPIFHQALLRQGTERPEPVQEDTNRRVYLHLPYHPLDPRSADIQRIFRDLLSSPKDDTPIANICNPPHAAPLNVDRLIVAYHRPRNLRNILFPRKFRGIPGKPVSKFCEKLASQRTTDEM